MQNLTRENLEQALKSSEYVIFDYSSPGCAPCRKVPLVLNEVVAELPDKEISLYEINITIAPELAQQYMVMGVPTIIVFKQGKEIKRFNSVPKKEKIKKAIT